MSGLIDILLPRACVVCGEKLGRSERHICTLCASQLPFTQFAKMEHNPMSDKFNSLIQKDLDEGQREDYAYAASLLYYDRQSGYGHIPQALKYGRAFRQGRFFATMFGRSLAEAGHFADVDLVAPVPLHPLRRWKRGYNQAEVIASCVAAQLGVRMVPNLLRRTRNTLTQTQLSVEDKSLNVRGAFALTRSGQRHLEGVRHILIVDDVFTSGSTLNACRKAIRDVAGHGDLRISVATLSFVGEI